jgi:hypothetical protein
VREIDETDSWEGYNVREILELTVVRFGPELQMSMVTDLVLVYVSSQNSCALYVDLSITRALFHKRQGGTIYPTVRGYNTHGYLSFTCHLVRSPSQDKAWLYAHRGITEASWTSTYGGRVEMPRKGYNNRVIPPGVESVPNPTGLHL